MIRPDTSNQPNGLKTPAPPVLVAIWATGADPALDGVVRITARRMLPAANGGLSRAFGAPEEAPAGTPYIEFDQFCDPFPDRPTRLGASSAAIRGRFGLGDAELRDQGSASECWRALREFIGDAPLLVHDADLFRAWQVALDREIQEPARQNVIVGVEELERMALGSARCQASEGPDEIHWFERPTPNTIAERFGRLVESLDRQDPVYLALWTLALQGAAFRFEFSDPSASRQLYWALDLLNRPEAVCLKDSELFQAGA
ncbi:MAG: hypothetical protein KDB61_09580, partial [Planctomycetes bacterium]|nr:hypothetical protein [Planctomycetota bacterium]